jgi:hypothetical protein
MQLHFHVMQCLTINFQEYGLICCQNLVKRTGNNNIVTGNNYVVMGNNVIEMGSN